MKLAAHHTAPDSPRYSFFEGQAWHELIRELHLSPREAEIIRCLLTLDDHESSIAEELSMSRHTVHTHLERLHRKLNVTSRCQLVARVFTAYVRLDRDKLTV